MFRQRSDADRDLVYLVCDDTVTPTDLAGHRRAAMLAARDLGRPFAVVTDLTGCADISTSAAGELEETVRHLAPFGLGRIVRVVSDGTPERVHEAFDSTAGEVPVEEVTVEPGEEVGPVLDAHLAKARQ